MFDTYCTMNLQTFWALTIKITIHQVSVYVDLVYLPPFKGPRRTPGFDVAFCSALISACRGGSAWHSALQLCFSMAAVRVVPGDTAVASTPGTGREPAGLGGSGRMVSCAVSL